MTPFERLTSLRYCHELVLAIYRATASWPGEEKFGLTSQVRRAAVSAGANLAEGAAKRGSAEFRRFTDISLGSLSELTYLLRVARDLSYLSVSEFDAIEAIRDRAGKSVWRLHQALSKRRP